MNNSIKYISGCLILLIFALKPLNAATISLSERQGPPGSIIRVPLNFTNVARIAGAEFLIKYDPALLEFVSVSLSTFTEDFIIAAQNEDDRVAVLIASGTGLQQAKGVLLYLNFRIRLSAQNGTSTELTIVSFKLYDADGNILDAVSEHGLLKITGIVVYPNPITPNNDGFNDYANFVVPDSISSSVTVKIYSITGSKVREFSGINHSTLQWDGRDENGKMLRPGPYIYLVQSENTTLSNGTITIMH